MEQRVRNHPLRAKEFEVLERPKEQAHSCRPDKVNRDLVTARSKPARIARETGKFCPCALIALQENTQHHLYIPRREDNSTVISKNESEKQRRPPQTSPQHECRKQIRSY